MNRELIFFFLLTPGLAAADVNCSMTMDDIFTENDREKSSLKQGLTNKVKESSKATLKSMPSNSPISGGDTGGNMTDFEPALSLAGLAGDLLDNGVSKNDDALAIDYNLDLGEDAGQIKLQASLNRKAEINAALLESIDTDIREAFKTENDGFDLTDDVTYSISYSFGIAGLGQRSLRNLEEVFLSSLGGIDILDQAQQKAFNDIAKRSTNGAPDLALDKFDFEDPNVSGRLLTGAELRTKRQELCDAAIAWNKAIQKTYTAEHLALQSTGFAELVNNRNQLVLNLSYKDRDDLIGPSETSAKLSYEFGFQATAQKMLQAANSANCNENDHLCRLGVFTNYIQANQEAISAQNRFKISVEYLEVDDYAYSSELNDIAFTKEGSDKLIAAFGYGRALQGKALDYSRLDFELKYEDIDNDPDRNDRYVGTLTLSKRIAPGTGWTIPFTLVYSNKSEFVNVSTDDKFSAHFGIRWDLED